MSTAKHPPVIVVVGERHTQEAIDALVARIFKESGEHAAIVRDVGSPSNLVRLSLDLSAVQALIDASDRALADAQRLIDAAAESVNDGVRADRAARRARLRRTPTADTRSPRAAYHHRR